MDIDNYSPNASVTDMQEKQGWRSLEQMRADATLIMMYKFIQGYVAIPLLPYLQQLIRTTRHRHPQHLAPRQIHTSLNYYKSPFFSLAVMQWNMLPAEVLVLPTLEQFRVAIRCQGNNATNAKKIPLLTF